MKYIVKGVFEEGGYREVERLMAELKSARRELRAERRKVRRPHV